jgi:hypothetical protein
MERVLPQRIFHKIKNNSARTIQNSIQWYGHVVRMQDYRKPKQAVEARMGRKEEVEEDQGGLGRTV